MAAHCETGAHDHFFYGSSGAQGETRDLCDSDNNAELDPDMEGSWGWNLAATQRAQF